MEKKVLTLEHPAVQVAKAKWEALSKRGYKRKRQDLRFEDWFEYFKADCIRMTAIAECTGLTKQRVSQIYIRHFHVLFGSRSGLERLNTCTLEGRLVLRKQAEHKLFSAGAMQHIAEGARAAGHMVEARNAKTSTSVLRNEILISGAPCRVYVSSRPWQPPQSDRSYMIARFQKHVVEQVTAAIVRTESPHHPHRTFVIPRLVLLDVCRRSRGGVNCIYLPVESSRSPRGITRRIDWWQYENAWHLIPLKKQTPVPE